MHRPLLLAASMLAADGGKLREEAQHIARAGADWLHLDVMDGHFVPNLTFGPDLVRCIVQATPLYCDVHLMVTEPQQWIEPFAQAGAHNLTVHVEATNGMQQLLRRIRQLGCEAGISLKPGTPVAAIEPVLHEVQNVLVMSVEPGFGGQKYNSGMGAKITQLAALRQQRGLDFRIEVDGGINTSTIGHAYHAGADVCVAGTALFSQDDYGGAVRALRDAASQHAASTELS